LARIKTCPGASYHLLFSATISLEKIICWLLKKGKKKKQQQQILNLQHQKGGCDHLIEVTATVNVEYSTLLINNLRFWKVAAGVFSIWMAKTQF